ncbi:amidohydrolase family protein [Microbulbifer sp. SAOS-129_SWC]|uniref:amidohydrolase family protein n=1 Tax=Microbulbifer sp. SAOS-129_SWC TaxID=3145235 RepID=UPI00321636B8
MNTRINTIILNCALVLGLASAAAQADTLLIKGGKVYTLANAGTLKSADVLVRDGHVEAVGAGLDAQADKVIDASGKIVTPGVIAADTLLGLTEIGAAMSTNDDAAVEGDNTKNVQIGTSYDPLPAYNPHSTLIPFNRAGGVTRAMVIPDSQQKIFAGRGFAIELNGDFDSVVGKNLVQRIYLGESGAQLAGGSRAVAYAQLRQALNEAREYAANRDAIRRGDWRDLQLPLSDLEALQPLVNGREVMLVKANRASDILQTIKLAQEFKLRLVIDGAAEGWMVAKQLAAAKVPVVIDAMDNLPIAFESLGARLDNAALLNRAGVQVLISGPPGSLATYNAYLARQGAGNAVANGMPYEAALKAISRNVAQVFGIDGGTIEPGAVADIVVWSGDPLEVTSYAEQVLIDGVPQSLVSRSTRLRDRYLTPQPGHEAAYKF